MRRKVRWIPETAIRAMHAELLAEHGGRPGIRDAALLSSALARPRNRCVYGASASLFDLAAAYGFGIVKNHPFIDGNKRLALAVMYVFLDINAYLLDAPEVEAAAMILRLAAGELGEKDLAGWLKANSVPSRNPRRPSRGAGGFALVLLLLLLPGIGPAPARAEYFTIRSFLSDIVVHRDSSLTVSETIQVDFTRSRHGIYRDIPFRYTDELGNRTVAPLSVVSVTDGANRPRKYKVSRYGDAIRIRIGHPRRYVKGAQVYVITYTVKNAILFLEDRDELYWNVTGDGWRTTIGEVFAKVVVEGSGTRFSPQGACYTGYRGSREAACDFTPRGDGGRFRAVRSLKAREGFTIALGWDKGIVSPPSSWDAFLWRANLSENWVFGIPLAVFFLMLARWYRKGRDPDVGDTVAVMYTPPEEGGRTLLPAEIGALFDERLDSRDVTASIVHLAVKGYVGIQEKKREGLLFDKTDYLLTKVKEPDDDLSAFEKLLLEKLFAGSGKEVLVSDLKYRFYRYVDDLKAAVFKSLKEMRYFAGDPDRIRMVYRGAGFGIAFLGFFAGILLTILTGGNPFKAVGAFLVSGGIVALFASRMPAKTRRGALARNRVKGFEEFLVRAEKDRLERMKDANLFEKYLPYAIALNVSDRWAEAFGGVYQEMPQWYSSPGGSPAFHPVSFHRSLGSALSTMGSAMYAAPRSSGGGSGGGGSSGGGFGGGGGGSW